MNEDQARPIYWLESAQPHAWDGQGQLLRFAAGSHLLIYVEEGDIRVRADDVRWEGHAGQLVYVASGRAGAIDAAAGPGACRLFRFQALIVGGGRGRWTAEDAPRIPFLREGPLPVRGGGSRLHELAAASGEGGCGEERDWRFQQLLRLLRKELREAPGETAPHGGIERTIAYMRGHYNERISRETLAHIAGLAPNSYWRSFKREKGVSPTAYLQQIRVEHAKRRLLEGAPIREAAESAGFGSEFYMSRVFKKWTGIPPSLYVKRHALKVAVASRFLYQDSLRALGIEPALAIDCYRYPLMDESEYEMRLLRQTAELRAAAPDLIIGDFSHVEHLDWMKSIAPTVTIPHSLEWRTPFLHLADLVGRKEEAERVVAQIDGRIAGLAERIASRAGERTVCMLQIMQDHVIVQGTVNHPLNDLLYGELKLKPDRQAPLMEMRRYLQLQDMPALQSDLICVRLYRDHPDVAGMWRRLRQLPFWSGLPAVLSGRVHMAGNWLVGSWTPQGRLRIAEELAGLLAPD